MPEPANFTSRPFGQLRIFLRSGDRIKATGWKGRLMRLDGLVGPHGSIPREWAPELLVAWPCPRRSLHGARLESTAAADRPWRVRLQRSDRNHRSGAPLDLNARDHAFIWIPVLASHARDAFGQRGPAGRADPPGNRASSPVHPRSMVRRQSATPPPRLNSKTPIGYAPIARPPRLTRSLTCKDDGSGSTTPRARSLPLVLEATGRRLSIHPGAHGG